MIVSNKIRKNVSERDMTRLLDCPKVIVLCVFWRKMCGIKIYKKFISTLVVYFF